MKDPTPETAQGMIGKTATGDTEEVGVITGVYCEHQWTARGLKVVWTIFADFGPGDKRGFHPSHVELVPL